VSKKKPKQETPPNLYSPIGSITYDAKSKSFNTVAAGDAVRERAQTSLENTYADQAQNYQNFQSNPSLDKYFTDYYMPTMEKELASRQGQFQANLGRRAASTMGMLTAQKQAQNDAIFRAGIPRQYDTELLNRLGLLGQHVRTSQNIRYEPYRVLQSLYNQGGSAPIYDNAMNRNIEREKIQMEKQAALLNNIGTIASALVAPANLGNLAKLGTKSTPSSSGITGGGGGWTGNPISGGGNFLGDPASFAPII